MGIKERFVGIKELVINNRGIIENYFFMTILQVLNSFFYLLIYPYLIRSLGASGYGLFVFATSISTYFGFIISFGFDFPATKAIAESVGSKIKTSYILSCIFTAKVWIGVIVALIFSILLFLIPLFREHQLLFVLCFVNVYGVILFPQWFFQGIQQMKVVTGIQLLFKLLSLPLIFITVKNNADLNMYALIVTLSTLLGAIVAFVLLRIRYRLTIRFVKLSCLRNWFRDAWPFFLSNSAGMLKEQSIPIIIGAFFGMKEVAIYDLANKLIIVPRTIFVSINGALFPKIVVNAKRELVKKVIKFETLISLSVIVGVLLFGRWVVEFMGGKEMLNAYYLASFLSVTVMSWLVVGAYISFVFIPNKKYFFVSKNQIVALSSFFVFSVGGLLIYPNIIVFGVAMALSGLSEIFYCKYLTYKYKLL